MQYCNEPEKEKLLDYFQKGISTLETFGKEWVDYLAKAINGYPGFLEARIWRAFRIVGLFNDIALQDVQYVKEKTSPNTLLNILANSSVLIF